MNCNIIFDVIILTRLMRDDFAFEFLNENIDRLQFTYKLKKKILIIILHFQKINRIF